MNVANWRKDVNRTLELCSMDIGVRILNFIPKTHFVFLQSKILQVDLMSPHPFRIGILMYAHAYCLLERLSVWIGRIQRISCKLRQYTWANINMPIPEGMGTLNLSCLLPSEKQIVFLLNFNLHESMQLVNWRCYFNHSITTYGTTLPDSWYMIACTFFCVRTQMKKLCNKLWKLAAQCEAPCNKNMQGEPPY